MRSSGCDGAVYWSYFEVHRDMEMLDSRDLLHRGFWGFDFTLFYCWVGSFKVFGNGDLINIEMLGLCHAGRESLTVLLLSMTILL